MPINLTPISLGASSSRAMTLSSRQSQAMLEEGAIALTAAYLSQMGVRGELGGALESAA